MKGAVPILCMLLASCGFHLQGRTPLPEAFASLAQLLETIIDKVGDERFPAPPRLNDAAWVAYRLAESLPLEASLRQELLEVRDPLAALSEVKAYLQSKSVTV